MKFAFIIGGGTFGGNAAGGIPGDPVKLEFIGGGFLGSYKSTDKYFELLI